MIGRRLLLIPLCLCGWLACSVGGAAQVETKTVEAQLDNKQFQLLDAKELAAVIDQHIAEKWQKNDVTPAPAASDAEFFRRVNLDIAGRIPRAFDVRTFVKNPSDDKRDQVIEKLVAGPQYVAHFTSRWHDLLIPQRNDLRLRVYNRNFQAWLLEQVRENVGYDKLVYELLTSPATNRRVPGQPYNPNRNATYAFFQANELKPENLAAATSRIFLGVRLECAQCHDHPFADWERDQFWSFAAFYSGIRRPTNRPGQAPANVPANSKSIQIPGTKRTVEAKFLDGSAPNWPNVSDPRTALADWLTSPENPYFARTTVNRLWGHFFGIGLIDPVDDEPTPENPPSHPALLKELTRQFAAHEFDVRYLIRAITMSKTYQLSSKQTHASQKDARFFARMPVRGMTPEQLFDSLAVATGYSEPPGPANRQFVLNPNSPRTQFLQQFESTDAPTEKTTSILQALNLMNGQLVADATSLEKSQTLAAVAEAPFFTTEERIEALYLASLSRFPRTDELQRLSKYVNSGGPRQDQKAALADVFWALLNCSEFMLNH